MGWRRNVFPQTYCRTSLICTTKTRKSRSPAPAAPPELVGAPSAALLPSSIATGRWRTEGTKLIYQGVTAAGIADHTLVPEIEPVADRGRRGFEVSWSRFDAPLGQHVAPAAAGGAREELLREIGRASCRERGWRGGVSSGAQKRTSG